MPLTLLTRPTAKCPRRLKPQLAKDAAPAAGDAAQNKYLPAYKRTCERRWNRGVGLQEDLRTSVEPGGLEQSCVKPAHRSAFREYGPYAYGPRSRISRCAASGSGATGWEATLFEGRVRDLDRKHLGIRRAPSRPGRFPDARRACARPPSSRRSRRRPGCREGCCGWSLPVTSAFPLPKSRSTEAARYAGARTGGHGCESGPRRRWKRSSSR